jgi:protein phosphatase
LRSPDEVDAAIVTREPLWNDKRDLHGPFDVIGDVHGCCDELEELLASLGYAKGAEDGLWLHPEGRLPVFLGDLVDRGPRIVDTLKTVMPLVECEKAICVPGNHDMKLMRKLRGKNVQITHGLDRTLAELDKETIEFVKAVEEFASHLVSHYVLDDGKLVVAHAGMSAEMQGRGSAKVREFALYGETTGETDEFGLPVRYPWAEDYRGQARVVYGHTPVPEPEWLNRTVNIDTGCVFGGALTALRYPEMEFVSVDARATYVEPAKPFLEPEEQAPRLSAQHEQDDLLDIDDVLGKRIISTPFAGNVTIREENAAAALEVMTRWAANPKWIIYLPPTMSPSGTSKEPGLLEHPAEAFDYYRHEGVARVVCEEKHMGSRAVVIACKDAGAARERFGVSRGETGVCYTRTGRPFFPEPEMEATLVDRVRSALTASGFWDELETDWVCLDCELMPWSAKAQALLLQQYAPVASAGRMSLAAAVRALEAAEARDLQVGELKSRVSGKAEMIEKYAAAYGNYCWPVDGIGDYKLAPFHVLATEGKVHIDRDHVWHMETLAKICRADDGLLLATPFKVLDVTDEKARAEGVGWWESLTGEGGEGMVVKPLEFAPRGRRRRIQPAVKCRGREYLRIIYGPEYTTPEHLDRLRQRGLGHKRSLAAREFALGIEALQRFVRKEPLRRVHECVFGVLALESEPVDPRL